MYVYQDLIRTIVNKKLSYSYADIKKLAIEQKAYTYKESICNELNTYFYLLSYLLYYLALELPQGNI